MLNFKISFHVINEYWKYSRWSQTRYNDDINHLSICHLSVGPPVLWPGFCNSPLKIQWISTILVTIYKGVSVCMKRRLLYCKCTSMQDRIVINYVLCDASTLFHICDHLAETVLDFQHRLFFSSSTCSVLIDLKRLPASLPRCLHSAYARPFLKINWT